jgi:hypothetical protein
MGVMQSYTQPYLMLLLFLAATREDLAEAEDLDRAGNRQRRRALEDASSEAPASVATRRRSAADAVSAPWCSGTRLI